MLSMLFYVSSSSSSFQFLPPPLATLPQTSLPSLCATRNPPPFFSSRGRWGGGHQPHFRFIYHPPLLTRVCPHQLTNQPSLHPSFNRFTGNRTWHHGDFVVQTRTGGLVMKGRSDGVLKPAGVRFGSAEIYNVLARSFAGEVEDAVCVGRRRPSRYGPDDGDETVCLFVVMAPGHPFVRGETDRRIRDAVRAGLSARHVPAVVDECGPAGVPRTGNGKKVEVAVKQILSGMEVRTNASVANPEALEWFRGWAEGHP